MKCEHCETEFMPANKRQRFCCRNCSIYSWNKYNNYKPKEDLIKKKVYRTNWNAVNKNKKKELSSIWYIKNKDKSATYNKIYREKNPLKVKELNKKWKIYNKNKITKQAKERYNSDINFQLRSVLRARLNQAINNGQKAGSAVDDLGCSINKLKISLQLKFHRNPRNKHEYMTWDNWSRTGWHIDHIKPLDSFNLSDTNQIKIACHYTNLQPMWATDNLKKGNNLILDITNRGENV